MVLKKLPIKALLRFLFNNPLIFIVLIVATLTVVPLYYQRQAKATEQKAAQASKYENKYLAFTAEVYDKIMSNYWDVIKDEQLVELYRLSLVKNMNQQNLTAIASKDEMLKILEKALEPLSEEERQKQVPILSAAVLSSLNPAGRSGLMNQQLQQQLMNTVQNVNPDKDLYKDLGLEKGASEEKVAEAYKAREEELKTKDTPEAKAELEKLAYAKGVLTDKDEKARYDTNQVEPTIFTRIVSPGILYMEFHKFSPTSYDEFIKAFDKYKDDNSLNALIFDIRGNLGGAIDAAPYFLGNFIGKGQYAFEFYHKGEYEPFKTPTEKLPTVNKFRQVILLIDNATQSSGEIMAAGFKKYNIGTVVGVNSKGWGTVERVFPLDNQLSDKEKYSVFLVHSITLRDDNQPVEGRGVEPNVNITVTGWEQTLNSFVRNQALVEAVSNVVKNTKF